jgi:hypothetical protein
MRTKISQVTSSATRSATRRFSPTTQAVLQRWTLGRPARASPVIYTASSQPNYIEPSNFTDIKPDYIDTNTRHQAVRLHRAMNKVFVEFYIANKIHRQGLYQRGLSPPPTKTPPPP